MARIASLPMMFLVGVLAVAGGPARPADGEAATLARLEARVEALEGAFRKSVVLTSGPCSDLGPGWAPLRPASGRFLLAANPDDGGEPGLSARVSGDVGGVEAMTLGPEHTPPHRHDVALERHTHSIDARARNHLLQRGGAGGRTVSLQALELGRGETTGVNSPATMTTRAMPAAQAVDLMPPFFVVNACGFAE